MGLVFGTSGGRVLGRNEVPMLVILRNWRVGNLRKLESWGIGTLGNQMVRPLG